MTAILPYSTGDLELAVEMAIGGSGVNGWDQSAWDFAAWASDTSGGWVDVTCDTSEVTLASGASAPDGLLTAINGTTGGVTLHGDQYNPWAPPQAPGLLGPAVPVRLRWRHVGDASFQTAFTGVTDGWPFDRASGTAPIPILNATGLLANMTLPTQTPAVGQGETIDQRMNRILNAAAWSTGLRVIPADSHRVISTELGQAPWVMLQTAADTGIGLLWVKRTGEVAYLPVGQAGGWTPNYLAYGLADVNKTDTWVCVVNYVNSEPAVTRNVVSITRAADPLIEGDTPAAVVAQDSASVAQFGPHTYERADLINQDDGWSATLAGAVLLDGAWPLLHPQVAALDIRQSTHVADLLLSAEIGDVLMVQDTGQLFTCAVVGYSVDIVRKGLTGTLVLSDVTRWVGGRWDTDGWDVGIWSI
jgi:hypothetical protein